MGRLVERWGGVVPAVIVDAYADAKAIVEAARREADEIRAEARRSGERAGRDEAAAACTELIVGARLDAERVRSSALSSARVLALRMAEKIVARAIDLDPSVLTAIAAQALEAARAQSGVVTLRVHPEDAAALARDRAALLAHLRRGVELRIEADASISRPGCVVETPAGRVDAQLETQLAALASVIGDAPQPPGPGAGPAESNGPGGGRRG